MNNPTPPDTPEVVAETPAAPPPNDNRRRLRELLSVPERDRTDEQWDEIIELEIQLAPGNRISGPEQGFGGPGKAIQGRPGGGHPKKHRPRNNQGGGNAGNPGNSGGGGNNNNRRPRSNKPQGNPTT